MKHITRAQRPYGTRSEYAKATPICVRVHLAQNEVRWGGLVTLTEAMKLRQKETDAAVTYALTRDENTEPPKSELCPRCVAEWVDIKLTKRWEQPGDEHEYQGPSAAEAPFL